MRLIFGLIFTMLIASAQERTIAVIGLVHSHAWPYVSAMASGKTAARLVGVQETNPELIAEAKRRGVQDSDLFTDPKKLLDERKPDIVWAFVENNRHLEIMKLCAPRKIHVMFEKPLAASARDALAIRDLARQHNVQVLSNYQMAWWPSLYTAKQVIDSGELGKPWRVRGIVGHGGPGSTGVAKHFFDWLTDPDKNGGGALIDFGCYNALWSLWILGPPDKVYAHTNQLRPGTFPKVEDNSTMILSYKNAVALLEGSWDLPRSFQDLEVFGLEGSVFMKNGIVTKRMGRTGAETPVPIAELPPERRDAISYMVDRINKQQPVDGILGIDINVDVVRIMDAAQRSLKSSAAVPLR